jgi:cellulose synthase operon protein C
MTVRWKPLILLSALFLMVGVMGVIAITYALAPGRSSDLLALAKVDWKAKRYEKAQIQFRRALQVDPKNASIHEQLAAMYAEWSAAAPGERPKLTPLRLQALSDAAKYDKRRVPARKALVTEALEVEDTIEAARWARELVAIDPQDADANFALALDGLSADRARVAEARPFVEALAAAEPASARTDWARAEIARQTGDEAALATALASARSHELDASASTSLRLIRLRLLLIDVQVTTEVETLFARVLAFRQEAERLSDAPEVSAPRVAKMGRMIALAQKHVAAIADRDATAKERLAKLSPVLDELADGAYKKAVAPSAAADPRIFLAYAEHLLVREKRVQCLEIVDRALQIKGANAPAWLETMMQIREVAVKASLLDAADPKRLEKAAPHIQALIEGSNVRYQAVGHLFQGVIDLEGSGLAAQAAEGGTATSPAKDEAKLRVSALSHLRKAAAGLADVPAANALYGVTLLLSQEPQLGRQYLQSALRMGNLEPRYQVWAAWSMLQAGYPEEAQPIVDGMLAFVAAGKVPADLGGSLHLLKAQIHQARRGPGDLEHAKSEYEAAIKAGQPNTPAIQLRLAQIEVQLGRTASGQRRIEEMRTGSTGGPAAEQLSILLLKEQGKADAARQALKDARAHFPDSDELVALEVSFLLEQKRAVDADRTLAEYVAKHPANTEVVLLRARLLASDELKNSAEARRILADLCERAVNSTPFVQLALLDLKQERLQDVEITIAKIRGRWKESSAGDLLDAQLCLARQQPREALKFLDQALTKDPSNKLALFWKAQLEEKVGAGAEAAKIYEDIARDKLVKEVDPGLTLATAAQWALAAQALDNQDFDGAINRFDQILKSGDANDVMTRSVRWRLVQAHAAKGDWKFARREMEALLKEPKLPSAERIRGANLYRLARDYEAARGQLNIVLRDDPTNSQAAAVAAYLLADEKRPAEASKLLREVMKRAKQPPSLYLMLAAVENLTPPSSDALKRALGVIDEGIATNPDSVELVRAKSRLTRLATGNADQAIAVVAERAKADKDGVFRRLLADVYREENRLADAQRVVRGLLDEKPDDSLLMTILARLVAARAAEAAARGDRAAEKSLNDETAKLLGAFRAKNPKDLGLAEVECDLAARRGDLERANAITKEIDQIDSNSPVGPLLRAKLQAARGNTEAVADAYEEASSRAPRRIDIRMALAQASLAAGKLDVALKQAEFALETDRDRIDALLVKAQALSRRGGTPDQVATNQVQAIALLKAALAKKPATPEALSHLLAEIQYQAGDRTAAIATVKAGLAAAPSDENGVAMLAQMLTESRTGGTPAAPAELREAAAFAREVGAKDAKGNLCLALAVGFHKAGQIDLALPWAETAATRLDLPVVHLNLGDILLAKGEAAADSASAKDLFEKANVQYDLVLKAQANSIEAINNKAWILHRYLNRNAEALALVETLAKRADPAMLPAEFLDTLGAILESAHRQGDAEEAYDKGLKKAPEHPVLNYHMGRLLSRDASRKEQASRHLEKALVGRDRLGRAMADDAEGLLRRLGG